ncbi:unnamed protein product [Heligmosomoides polygyrus]|uniref:Endo/exonuclease/phosphatase domain-containing protein n=1 Tax=Heligmosomoides polygyrus TaxID=6339 RepID=A0A183GHP7_HELPZ|nr:unnamed protein product [Heligmosomoides polygyrus]
MNIDSYESLTSRIGRLRLKRCDFVTALTVFAAHAPTFEYDDKEVEAFYVELEFYKEDHTFYKVIVGDFNAIIGPPREELHIGAHGLEWKEQETSRRTMGLGIPGGPFPNEVDHITLNRMYCLTNYTGLDHLFFRTMCRS